MSAPPVFSVRDLRKRFDGTVVLDGLTIEIPEGEIFGFLGGNGAGKSTAINIVTNQLGADSGDVEILGLPPGVAANRLIGLAPQEVALYQQLSVIDNLRFFAGAYGYVGRAKRAYVDRVVEMMDLHSVRNIPVENLSGGWSRRLNLAAALVHRPRIAILDESTVGMDVEARFRTWQTVRRLKTDGVTVVFTTHLMDEAEAVCDRIGILHEGKLAALGTMKQLRRIVPASQLADVECDDTHALVRCAEAAKVPVRDKAGRLTLFLPKRTSIRDLVEQLTPVEIRSVRLRDVSLGDVFLEICSEE